MIGEEIREARRAAGMTMGDLAGCVGVSKSTIHRLEAGDIPASHEVVQRIASELAAPELVRAMCRQCPIHHELLLEHCPDLTNVNLTPGYIAARGQEEAVEMAEALGTLARLWDCVDWAQDDAKREQVVEALGQVHDVLTLIGTLYKTLFVLDHVPQEMLNEVRRRHRAKCVARGYCLPEAAA